MRRATRSAPIAVLLLAARSSAVVVRRRTLLGGGGAALLRPQSAAAAPVADGLIFGTCCDTGAGVRDVVRGALDEGWRQVDTSAFYGNEADVGAAIRDAGARDARVTSKVWFDDMTYERARASGLRSRELLGDALDTLLVHFPGSTDAVQSPKANALRRAATWEALVDLKRAGVVRRVGVSNYVPRHAREQLRYNGVPDVVQLESHPFCGNAELAGLWRDAGVKTIQSYSPFASGRAPVLTHPSVRAVADAKKSTPAAVVLAWLRARGLEPVVKASSPGHRRDAVASLALRLGDDDLAALDALDRGAGGSVAFDARLIA